MVRPTSGGVFGLRRDFLVYMSPLQQSILKTLTFFDLFSQPLTVQEVYRFLYCPPSGVTRVDVVRELKSAVYVTKLDGVYALKNGKATMGLRGEHVRNYIQKMKHAKRATWLISCVPFVRAVFVCNTVGFGVPTEKSDIDVVVIAKDKTIFLTRFLVTMLLSVGGFRRHGRRVQNKICLSFYLAEKNLSLQSLAIERDIYLVHWIALLIPVFDPDQFHARMLRDNAWVSGTLPFACTPYIPAGHIRVSDSVFGRCIRRVCSFQFLLPLWRVCEMVTKRLQLWWMKDKLERVRSVKSAVIVSDTMLKFHEEDRRVLYRDEWESKGRMQN